MNRSEFHSLARQRLRDAEVLLAGGCWSAAYYLSGYAVECGLKACILRRIEETGVIFDPDNKKFSEQCWTHDLERLVDLANLRVALDAETSGSPQFALYWVTVKDWQETTRYLSNDEFSARKLFQAITDANGGVLPWIQSKW